MGKYLSAAFCLLLVAACRQNGSTEPSAPAPPPLGSRGCVDSFDPAIDYFPDKAAPLFAERFSVEYFNHYKLVTVTLLDGATSYRYLLLQCGTPSPEVFADVQVIEIPVRTVVTTSTTELPHFVELGLTDRVVGHDELDYVSSPEIRRQIDQGKVVEVGHETRLNLEILLDLAPEMVLASSLGSIEQDVFAQLRQTGTAVVHVPSYLESQPLGQAEWILMTSLFFNREAQAQQIFDALAEHYGVLAELGRTATARPNVLVGAPIGDVWHVPGGRSFMALLIEDAGGRYLWADEPRAGTMPLALESVYDRATGADVWLHPGAWRSMEEIAAIDERFTALAVFKAGQVYSNDARMNTLGRQQGVGGNDYWESGTLRPDLVLADLMKILHPELVPEHELVYHRRLVSEP